MSPGLPSLRSQRENGAVHQKKQPWEDLVRITGVGEVWDLNGVLVPVWQLRDVRNWRNEVWYAFPQRHTGSF